MTFDPILLLPLGAAVLLWWRWRTRRARRRRLLRLTHLLRHERNPQRRHALLVEWRALGGPRLARRHARTHGAREAGRRARAAGQPISANPHPFARWGAGRHWRAGWRAVERQVRWLERHRA